MEVLRCFLSGEFLDFGTPKSVICFVLDADFFYPWNDKVILEPRWNRFDADPATAAVDEMLL